MAASFDVAIAGAGIIGAACAMECAEAGLSVVNVEPGVIGGGATAAGMGHIVVMDDSPAQIALTHYSRCLWKERAADLPPEVEYVEAGTIWVAAGEDEMAEVRRKQRVYNEIGVRAEMLDAQALREAEPSLRPGLAGGLLAPEDAVIYPPCAALHFMDLARRRGAVLRPGQAASLDGAGIRMGDGSLISAGIVVDATGAWATAVRKRKGHLAITDRYPGFIRHQLVELGYLKSAHSSTEDSVAFNVQPRRTGQVLIGSSRQFGVDDSAVDSRILSRMLARATEYMPALAGLLTIRCWTGFRAATADHLPLIGPSAGDPRVFSATGHEGLGITTSLATARLIVDQILGRPSEIPIEPYLPSRFEAKA